MIMGPVERAQRDARRAEERRKRREIMLAAQTGTPVTGYGLWKQRRDAGWTEYTDELGNRRWKPPAAEAQAKPEEKPVTVQRSPEEKPATVQQDGRDVNAFGSFKQNIASGLVRRMDIDGNWRWVDPNKKTRADTGMPLNPGRTERGTVSVQPDSATKPPDTSAEGAQSTLSDNKVAQIDTRTDVNAPTVETETSMGTIGRQTTETQRAADRAEDPGISKAAHAVADANIKVGTTEMENHAADERDAAVANMIAGVGQDHDYTPLNTQMERQRTEEVSLASLDQFMPEQRPPERMQPDGNDDEEKDQAASKAGYAGRFDVSRNFLATDRVPDSIFGYPVVSRKEDYTEEDIAFFREHPEAGGYYDLGEGSPEDGTEEGAPVQADMPDRGRYPGSWNNPGNVQKGETAYDGETGSVKSHYSDGSFLTFRTPQDGLNAKAQVIGQIVREKIPERYRDGRLPDDSFTVSNLISVYAPPEDGNDTEGYIKFVADRMGVERDRVLDQNDVKTMSSLLDAIVRMDSGHPHADWFTDAERETATRKMNTPARLRAKPKQGVKHAKKK